MSTRRRARKEYTNSDKFDVRLTRASSDVIRWVNEQENLSQSILELIEARVSQDSNPPPWVGEMKKQIIDGVIEELRQIKVVAVAQESTTEVLEEQTPLQTSIDQEEAENLAAGFGEWD